MSRLVKKYIEDLFEEKGVSEQNKKSLWKYYYDELSAGVDVGFSPSFEFYDKDLAKSLKDSIAEFSAFKETAFRKDLEKLLTTDGKLTPKKEFLKEAYKVSDDYNHRWLNAEYHQTVANANSAQKWKDYEAAADLYPNLKLVSVRDARVRPEHKALDGTIRPINDPFWDNHTPPLDWGCRCDLEQTDEEPTEVKGGVQMKIEFENNPAKSGKIFGGSAYERRITVTEGKEAKKNAKEWIVKSNMDKGKDKIPYVKPNLNRYKDIQFEKIQFENGYLEIFKSGKQSKSEFGKNKNALSILAKNNFELKMLPIIDDGNSNPDAYNILTGKFLDVKVAQTTNGKGALQNALKEASKQGCDEVLLHLTRKPESYKDMYQIMKMTVAKNRNKNIKKLHVIFPNNQVKTYDRDRFKIRRR